MTYPPSPPYGSPLGPPPYAPPPARASARGGTGLAVGLAAGGMVVGTLITTVVGIWAIAYVGRYDAFLYTGDAVALGASIGLGALLGRSGNPVIALAAAGMALVGYLIRGVLVSTWGLYHPPAFLGYRSMNLPSALSQVLGDYPKIVAHWKTLTWAGLIGAMVIAAGLALIGGRAGRKRPQDDPRVLGTPGLPPAPGNVPPGGPGERTPAPGPVFPPPGQPYGPPPHGDAEAR